MPDVQDIAALPTSWALTIWDALPIYLSLELAVAVVLTVLARGRRRHLAWRLTSTYLLGGLVYLALFDIGLTVVFALFALAQTGISLRTRRSIESPVSPTQALRIRGGDLLWAVAKASLAAAIIKTVLGPWLDSGGALWLPVAVVGAALAPIPLGVSAIPSLATSTSAGYLAPAIVWLVVAAARPFFLDIIQERSRPAALWREPS